MGTGASFVNLKNKMLLGFEDMGPRLLSYLKQLNIESVQSRWDVDGAFNTKLTLAGFSANTIQVGGSSKGTDGLGHTLDIVNAFTRNAVFENSNTVVYYVALFYAEVPQEIRINPRTGKPQYDHYTEEIGRSAAPTSVVDNGNGTITFNVNSVTESGVTNAGRQVKVFLNTPADGASTEATAIELLTVAFGGGNNTVTTAGALGQTTISTTASDYTVVLLGPSVARNTVLSTVSGAFFIGTVTGNGGTPATTDTSGQALLKTFQDATQVTYTPILWLSPGATTVQQAIDTLVSGLQANGTGFGNGAARVGIDPTAYSIFAIDQSQAAGVHIGGLGNVAEGTMVADETVGQALYNVDYQIQNVRSFTTYSQGYRHADYESLAVWEQALGYYSSAYFMRRLGTPATDGYDLSGDPAPTANNSIYVLGESSSPLASALTNRPRLMHDRTGGFSPITPGKYQRVYMDAPDTNVMVVNCPGVGSGGIFEDVVFHGGRFGFETMDTDNGAILPFDVRNCVVDPGSDTTHSQSVSLFAAGYNNQPMHGLISNTVILGLPAGVTTPTPTADFNMVSAVGSTDIEATPYDRPMKFANCLFISQRTSIPLVKLESKHKIVFENCHFFGFSGQTVAQLIHMTSGTNGVFRDCVFYGKEGAILNADTCYGLFDNCTFITGTGGSAISNPQIIKAVAGTSRPLTFRNCTVLINTSAIRDSGTAVLIQLGNSTLTSGMLRVDGMYVKYTGGSYIHPAETIFLQGGPNVIYRDITLDGGGLSYNSSAGQQNTQISALGATPCGAIGIYNVGSAFTSTFNTGIVDGLTTCNIGQANKGSSSAYVDILAYRSSLRNITTGKIATGTDQQQCELFLTGGCRLDGFQTATNTTYAKAIIFTDIGARNSMRGVRIGTVQSPLAKGTPTSGTDPFAVWISSSETTLDGFEIYTGGTGWNYEVNIEDHDVSVMNGRISSTSTSRVNGCIASGTSRGMLFSNINGAWDATSKNFLVLASNDSAVDNLTLYHSAGSTAAVNNTGTGNTVGTVIDRATLI